MRTYIAKRTGSSSNMALLVHLATLSRDSGGDEEQPELPWSSELPANALKGLCSLMYVVVGFVLLWCGSLPWG